MKHNIINFKLGRECLEYLVREYKIEEMNIPYYLCDVVRHTLVKAGCKPVFYHIDDNFMPSNKFPPNEYILYPNYFGVCGKNVKELACIYPKLIVDNAHAYYDEPSGFACFNAGHKFGKNDSTLWLDTNINNYEKSSNFLNRKENFLKLHEIYKTENLLNIDIESITAPFVYPFLAKSTIDADKLAKKLQNEGKTIYRYWNSLPKSFNEYKFYSGLVPIPLN